MAVSVLGALGIVALGLAGLWLSFSFVGVGFTLVVAVAVGGIVDRVVPGEIPYGRAGAVVAALAGCWLGSVLLGGVGPVVGRVPILAAVAGAIVVASVVELVAKHGAPRRLSG